MSTGLDSAFVNYDKTFRDIACLVGKMALLGFSQYHVGREGIEMLKTDQQLQNHRLRVEMLACCSNPQNHNFGIPAWVPDLLTPDSKGGILLDFYSTSHLQGLRHQVHK